MGPGGPMDPRCPGGWKAGGRKPYSTSKDYPDRIVLPLSIVCISCYHQAHVVNLNEFPNLLQSSTYFKAGPTLIGWLVYAKPQFIYNKPLRMRNMFIKLPSCNSFVASLMPPTPLKLLGAFKDSLLCVSCLRHFSHLVW